MMIIIMIEIISKSLMTITPSFVVNIGGRGKARRHPFLPASGLSTLKLFYYIPFISVNPSLKFDDARLTFSCVSRASLKEIH